MVVISVCTVGTWTSALHLRSGQMNDVRSLVHAAAIIDCPLLLLVGSLNQAAKIIKKGNSKSPSDVGKKKVLKTKTAKTKKVSS